MSILLVSSLGIDVAIGAGSVFGPYLGSKGLEKYTILDILDDKNYP